jgi:HEAT repeat protein
MTDAEKIRRLPWGVAADSLTTVFGYLTLFGNPFILMLGVLGLPKTQIGLLLSLFPFFGVTSLVTAPYVARLGFKRTFLTFWTIRYFVVLLLLLLPYVYHRWGVAGAFHLTAAALAAFAFCRAVGETAGYPWSQETIPHSVRAKYVALDTIVASLAGAVSLGLAGWVIGQQKGLQPFMLLIAVGAAFGLVGTWAVSHLPGGAPLRDAPEATSHAGMKEALRDGNFRLYLGATATFTLAVGPGSFLPLYLEQQVGLTKEVVVWLQIAGVAGTVLTSYFWGWATDRYGGKPVVLTALPVSALMPIFWFMIPRHSPWSVPVAAALFALGSALWMGWALGTNRLLFVKIVPPERKTQYMAVNYAWMGVVGGVAPLLAGWALDQLKDLTGAWGPFAVDQYSLLWAANAALAALTILWVARMQVSGEMAVGRFTGMFLHGNPLLAAEALIRHSLAMEEKTRLSSTELMGRAKSPLHVEELIESLHDPSFNVRHEAIVALGHMTPDERSTAALVEVLEGRQPDLAVAAAWALGRLGDRRALEPLRAALDGDFPMVRAASARALGTLRDEEAAPLLLEKLQTMPQAPLRTAYAAALGNLRHREAAGKILELMREPSDSAGELALALALLVGGERHFIRLWRGLHAGLDAAAAQAAQGWRRALRWRRRGDEELQRLVAQAERAFLDERPDDGVTYVRELLVRLAGEPLPPPLPEIMRGCAELLARHGPAYPEVLLLSMHVIGVALGYPRQEAEGTMAKES